MCSRARVRDKNQSMQASKDQKAQTVISYSSTSATAVVTVLVHSSFLYSYGTIAHR